MKNLRLALALGLVAVTLATAVYIHQRNSSTFTGTSAATDNPFATNTGDGTSQQRGGWEDPVAVLVAIGGVAVALLVAGSAARERV